MRRNPAYDILRVSAIFFVVWLHVATAAVMPAAALERPGWLSADVLAAFSRWSVPAFVLLSGALLLDRPLHRDPRLFYRTRFRRILLPLLFWSVFYILWIFLNDRRIDFASLVQPLLEGKPYYHLWFMFMIAGLYLAAPLISALRARLKPAGQLTLAGVILAAGMLDIYLRRNAGASGMWFPFLWLPYTGYFLLGRWLAEHTPRFSIGFYAAVFVLSCLLTAAVAAGLLALGSPSLPWDLAFEYFSPGVALAAAAAFRCCQRLDPAALENVSGPLFDLAGLTFGVYLIHPIFLDLFIKFGGRVDAAPPLLIPLVSLAIFGLSLGLAALLAAHPRLKRLI
ncbi:uncharacterized protein conserved in bacteria [Longilinea arvoryzae]|uniref:Uncharacterized protein conserved in bacteria n=1 Tax=Longilinea arvoryzae TaxID=360412 RepID=A0A0S7BG31_9CHLR|nr:acyltransferase family protein [Longilinea arvoryzae]GAP13080.1 uncharacterized protein conserved in bacteria [Longilinea arvoryzae]